MSQPPHFPDKVTQARKIFAQLYLRLCAKDSEAKNPVPLAGPDSPSANNPAHQSNEYVLSALIGAANNHPKRDYALDVDDALQRAGSILNPGDEVAGIAEAKDLLLKYVNAGLEGLAQERMINIKKRWEDRERTRTQTGPNQSFPNR